MYILLNCALLDRTILFPAEQTYYVRIYVIFYKVNVFRHRLFFPKYIFLLEPAVLVRVMVKRQNCKEMRDREDI